MIIDLGGILDQVRALRKEALSKLSISSTEVYAGLTYPRHANPPEDIHSVAAKVDLAADAWSTLRLYLGYRVFLGALLVTIFYGLGHGPLGAHNPTLFAIALQIYLALSLLALMPAIARLGRSQNHSAIALFVDIVAITYMMHGSGGVQSGLGLLYAVSIALGSMSLADRMPLLFAALASLAVMTERIYSHLTNAFPTTAYAHAGLLGLSFFTLAFLAHKLSYQVRLGQSLTSRQASDLANLSRLNQQIIQQMHTGVLIIDRQESIHLINESAWRLLGTPMATRHQPLRQASPELAAQLHTWRNDPDAVRRPFKSGASGREVQAGFTGLDQSGELILVFVEDTAQISAKAQQMKLASLGRLTAGIAHEIRNPLGAIGHAAQLLDEAPDLAETERRMLQIILNNTRRVNEMIESILRLSRQSPSHPQPLALTPWLPRQLSEIGTALGLATQQVSCQVDPPGTAVLADPGQLRQILDVLSDNAKRHFDRAPEHLQLDIVAGINGNSGGPCIRFCDNGPGISADAALHLFEPFFTTRHDGTGLGLYIARQLSEANRIHLDFEPDTRGSCFRLSFPKPQRAPKIV